MRKIGMIVLLMLTLQAHAGHEVGNGGDAIMINDRAYSFDLYENGVEQDPQINPKQKIDPAVAAWVRKNLKAEWMPHQELAQKFSELRVDRPALAWVLIDAARNYRWVMINGPLKELDDAQDSVVGTKPAGLVQAAIRMKMNISISKPVWDKMNPRNRAALIIHELLYAITPVTALVNEEEQIIGGQQDVRPARMIVGYLYSRDFIDQGLDGLFVRESWMASGKPSFFFYTGFLADSRKSGQPAVLGESFYGILSPLYYVTVWSGDRLDPQWSGGSGSMFHGGEEEARRECRTRMVGNSAVSLVIQNRFGVERGWADVWYEHSVTGAYSARRISYPNFYIAVGEKRTIVMKSEDECVRELSRFKPAESFPPAPQD